jgi:diacylglycerol kinase (ATP)
MKKWLVILNPSAGAGNGLKALPEVKRLLDETASRVGLTYQLVQTTGAGHPMQLARQAAAEGYDIVVAVGGDGTVNEVVNGLMEAKQAGQQLPALGMLCVGRGNDFAGSLGFPADLKQACQVLVADRRKWVDIGWVKGGTVPQGRYFANCVGVGFDAVVTLEVKKLPRWGGFMSFVVGIFKTIFIYKDAPLAVIEYGGRTLTQRSLMISVMNGRRLGGGFYMTPDSQFDDGLLDLCIAEQMSPWRIIRLIPHFTKGTQASQPGIKMGQSAQIKITSQDKPIPAQTDGEIISTTGMSLEIALLPKQIEVIV